VNPEAELLEHVLEAHGGLDRWQSVRELAVHHRSGGIAFAAKFQGRTLAPRLANISPSAQRAAFVSYPPGGRGVFDHGAVSIETDRGEQIAHRLDPLSQLHTPRRMLWWDKLDLLYFIGSAMWNYLAAPFIFTSPGFELRQLEPWKEGTEVWSRLGVTFPPELHTHSRHQVFYFDAGGLLRRLDYTAEEFGKRADAAQYCSGHREFGGLKFPMRRRVFLRRPDGRPRRYPLLIWIDIEAVDVTTC